MTEQQGGSYASPFNHETEPEEPPRGSVLAYQRLGNAGRMLDYVSFRAGDGKWYTTGKLAVQGVPWSVFWDAVRVHAVGPIHYATAWAKLDLPTLDPTSELRNALLSPAAERITSDARTWRDSQVAT
jgi:hypothetical protein